MVLTLTQGKYILEEKQRAAKERRMSENKSNAEAKKVSGKGQTKRGGQRTKRNWTSPMTTPIVKKQSACFESKHRETVGQVKNESDVRCANAGCKSIVTTITDGVVYTCNNCESGDLDFTY